MKTISIILAALLCVSSANAVIVTCVSEGDNVVRIDYDATGEASLPIAFALDITVNNGATIPEIFGYKIGDSNAADPGFGIFPRSIQVDSTGRLISWGFPDVDGTLGTSTLSIEMASRYEGSADAPLTKDTLCRIRVNPNGAQTINVSVAQNTKAGGVVLENTTTAAFTGIGTVLNQTAPPPPQAPPAPASINYPSSSSTGQYNVTWPASAGATSYQLQRSADNGSTWTGVYSGANLTYAENIGNGNYRYRVRAVNTAGLSAWTTGAFNCVVTITQLLPPPEPATISYPSKSSTGKYNVNWAASTGAASYQLQRSADNGVTWTGIYTGPNLTYAENIGNGSFRYRVRAVNSAGSSPWRARSTNCVVLIVQIPPAPASITFPSTSNTGRYTVSWTASPGATSYQLYRSRNNGATWSRIYSGSNLSKAEAVSNGTYLYRVRAVNSAGMSGWTVGTHSIVVTVPRPTTPASISYPTTSSTGHYTVSWTASTNVTSYQLERSSNGGVSWARVYSGANLTFNEDVGSGSYRYRVRGVNYSVTGSWRTGTRDCVVSSSAGPARIESYDLERSLELNEVNTSGDDLVETPRN